MQPIRITGDINEAAYCQFAEELFDAQTAVMKYKQENRKITVEIHSSGGEALSALAFYDLIKSSKIPIITIGTGKVYSAAVLVLAAGHEVYMRPNTWVMVHEESGKEAFDNVVAIEREAAQYRRMEDQWCQLLELETNTPAATWSNLHKKTTYLDADECIKLGLVDGEV